MLQKCLIANRGEIAVRIIRACHELGMWAVAVYSTADQHARHVQLADEAYWIGEAPPQQSYLNVEALLTVAKQADCDCVHPGYGFLSEREYFAQAVLDAGLVWVGPPPQAIALMGVKTTARELMQRANVPIVKGFQSDSATIDEFLAQAHEIGFPIMVKAAGGGGGKGIRVVHHADDLAEAVLGAQSEARKAFNDERVFLERYIERGRHIEIQVLADTHGNTVHLFERECSAQRRHQKVIEESPSPLLTPAIRAEMGASAVRAAQAVGYVNAGTVEFIATQAGEFFFLEMNTRIQVEHPVTEMVTGVDIVKTQFAIANGEVLPFSQADLRQSGHAIEVRVYAEDPRNGFLPSIGTVHTFIPPQGAGIRVDSGIQSGDSITIHYDPMIAKIIVHDRTREEAVTRMSEALRQMVILGTTTNVDFLLALLAHPIFQQGKIDTTYLDQHLSDVMPALPPVSDWALIVSALTDLQGVSATIAPIADTSLANDPYSPWDKKDHWRMS
jgi:acetyl-CoA carboxylase biotin carboxylase subunit